MLSPQSSVLSPNQQAVPSLASLGQYGGVVVDHIFRLVLT